MFNWYQGTPPESGEYLMVLSRGAKTTLASYQEGIWTVYHHSLGVVELPLPLYWAPVPSGPLEENGEETT